MSSRAGPRAQGTDGQDHKFRQRVDTHYTLMASARISIRTACRLQLATALGLVARAGVAAMAEDELPQLAACGALALVASVGASIGFGVARSQSPEARAAQYSQLCWLLALPLLLLAVVAVMMVVTQSGRSLPMTALELGAALLGVSSAMLGVRAAGQLRHAFELQAQKRGTR